MSSKKAGAGAAAGANKSKVKAKDSAVKEECVAYIFDLLFAHLDRHIDDKRIFPQILAYAVSRTMAEMVHMVSIAHVQRMENWLVHLEGSAPEEWDKPQEPLVPLIDSWARGVIPLKKDGRINGNSFVDIAQQQEANQAQENVKQPRRASTLALSQYQDTGASRRRSSSNSGSKVGLRGSLRRFSESLYPLDPNRKVKFEEKAPNEIQKDVVLGRRSSTPPPSDFFQGVLRDDGSPKVNVSSEISPKKSLVHEDKLGKGRKAKGAK